MVIEATSVANGTVFVGDYDNLRLTEDSQDMPNTDDRQWEKNYGDSKYPQKNVFKFKPYITLPLVTEW